MREGFALMFANLAFIALALALLFAGAECLVRGSTRLALGCGISPLVVGLTVVSIGTGAPELFVSLEAAWSGNGDIAAGNVVGSNLFNVGVILGLSALVAPLAVRFQLLKVDAPLMVGVMCLVPLVLADGRVGRLEGVLLLGGMAAYVGLNMLVAKRTASAEIEAEYAESLRPGTRSLWLAVSLVAVGIATLAFGARMLGDNAVSLARSLGAGEAVIGLTIVAAGTSLPELAASAVAALRNEPDIAVGNIIGSNIFNVLGIFGFSGALHPFEVPGISHFDVYAMIGLSAALLPLMWTSRKLQRMEGGFLLLCYAGYLAVLWP